ncbi:hypothetical protein FRX31_032613 [Thalictrum thalictroides]|uniref:EF-1-gamma C-terminal domain-containing protein n=1 Tax=Thalictrum thalictroides TaxID=46969 RepID=A0A7J6UZF2_THATH|nr:hypothetical protein FRX31_032613 [Thalictrum thalictroides]
MIKVFYCRTQPWKWLYLQAGYAVYFPAVEETAIAQLKRALGALNTHLASNTFLVGHESGVSSVPITSAMKAAPAKESAKSKPKKETPKPKAGEPAEEEEVPKPKNPLDLLQPSKIILDASKST